MPCSADADSSSCALGEDEIERGLDVFHRFRWAVQADYFAGRIATRDMTGIEDPRENEMGMLAAREFLVD
ncbi:hypothetical protein GCM10009662_68340 [Catellatospora coxensis]|uniref:Uncharacterized protein n=1 Tax=Catellatospora coxensis TaxID=310354 RepID=A0A8J3P9F8_9ACTN|nr:hypothetical protein Cco03nite_34160 [Catellatospora coxensis]